MAVTDERFAPWGEYVPYDSGQHRERLAALARRLGEEEFGTDWEDGAQTKVDWEQVFRSIEAEGLDLGDDLQGPAIKLVRREYRKGRRAKFGEDPG